MVSDDRSHDAEGLQAAENRLQFGVSLNPKIPLISMEWFKSTVFQTVNKNHLHAEHAHIEKDRLQVGHLIKPTGFSR